MRLLAAVLALVSVVLAMPAFAASPQDGTFTITPPTTGGAPTGYRVYVDNKLFGTVTSGQKLTALVPDFGTYSIALEPFNSAGSGPRTTQQHTLGGPPGPATFTLTFSCTQTTPPTCTDVVVSTP